MAHAYLLILQENSWAPNQNQRSKDASADTGKGKVPLDSSDPFCA